MASVEEESILQFARIQVPGNQPQAVGEPTAGGVEPEAFRADLKPDSAGPFGPPFVAPEGVDRPFLGAPPPFDRVNKLRFSTFLNGSPSATLVPFNFAGPRVLSLRHGAALTSGTPEFLAWWATPHQGPVLNPPFAPPGSKGYAGWRGALYIPTAGTWYVGVGSDVAGVELQAEVLDASNPELVQLFREDLQGVQMADADTPVPAADTVLLNVIDNLTSVACIVQNVGANPLRLTWGDTSAAGTGLQLAVGERITFEGRTFPVAQLHGFGNGGATTAAVQRIVRGT